MVRINAPGDTLLKVKVLSHTSTLPYVIGSSPERPSAVFISLREQLLIESIPPQLFTTIIIVEGCYKKEPERST